MGRFAAFAAHSPSSRSAWGRRPARGRKSSSATNFRRRCTSRSPIRRATRAGSRAAGSRSTPAIAPSSNSALHPSTIYYRGESVPYRNASGASVTRVWSTPGRQFAIWEKDNFHYWNAQEQVLNSTLVDFSLLADGLASTLPSPSPSSRTGFTPRRRCKRRIRIRRTETCAGAALLGRTNGLAVGPIRPSGSPLRRHSMARALTFNPSRLTARAVSMRSASRAVAARARRAAKRASGVSLRFNAISSRFPSPRLARMRGPVRAARRRARAAGP